VELIGLSAKRRMRLRRRTVLKLVVELRGLSAREAVL